jgi:hypothetical protein
MHSTGGAGQPKTLRTGRLVNRVSLPPFNDPVMRLSTCLLMILLVATLSGCAVLPSRQGQGQVVPEQLPLAYSAKDILRWQTMQLPGKLRTAFRLTQSEQRPAVMTESAGSISMLRQKLRIDPAQLGALHFEWRVDNLIEGADMTQRESEDSAVRVVLAFDGDRSLFSPRNAMLSELSRTMTGEPMPYAVLMYVWSNELPVGTVITNPRTDRIRKIVVESGPQRLRQWLQYQRDVRADFEQAFGEAPGALQSIGIMTDTDNTRGRTQAAYGPIRLERGTDRR